jgi:transcriptional regulator with XRE-family HTH domain
LQDESDPVTTAKTIKSRKGFDELREQIDADPARRANVEAHKTAMLSELRRKLDLTQAIVADRLGVTQENVSQIERGEADVRLSTLSRYVEALGGHLEVLAAFPEQIVALTVETAARMRRRRTRRGSATAAGTPRNASATRAKKTPSAGEA